MLKTNIELLAPAGNMECLKTAVLAGADAVYLGLDKFNARIKADNFTSDTLKQAVEFAYERGVKVYLVFNTLLKSAEVSRAVDEIEKASKLGVDAFIIQDFGLLNEIIKRKLSVKIHSSTQMGIHNLEGAKVAQQLGISRVILSRETLKEDIKAIAEGTSLEIEAFVHGAICVSFSGNCYFSSLLAGESGNRGRCLQLCRKSYSWNKAVGRNDKKYLLSLKDLCLVDYLSELISLGVTSFKIEGRNRRGEYVGEVVSVYRKALDGVLIGKTEKNRLKIAFNRGDFTSGYIGNGSEKIIYDKHPSHIGLRVGVVSVISRGGTLPSVKIKYDNTAPQLQKGDGIKFMRSGIEVGTALISNPQLITFKGNIKIGDEVRLTSRYSSGGQCPPLQNISEKTNYLPIPVGAGIDRPNVILPQSNLLQINNPKTFIAINSATDITEYLYHTADYIVYNPAEYSIKEISEFSKKAPNKTILNLPNIMRGQDKQILQEIINQYDHIRLHGFIVNNLWGIEAAKNRPIILGTGLNILNDSSYKLFCRSDRVSPEPYYSYITSIESPISHPNAINYIYGYPSLMTFCHCVESGTTQTKKCMGNCKSTKNIFDDRGTNFYIKKRRIYHCYSELLNNIPLDNRELIDGKTSVYIDLTSENNPAKKLKEILSNPHNNEPHTHGNYKRGLK
ncbi:MAG: U32 family peptidase [Firmicutes bacterium]|nr:U32 family peptidase [Bacillota bacterium]